MEFLQIPGAAVSVWATTIDVDAHRRRPPFSRTDLWRTWPELAGAMFRGVSSDRLQTVLQTGVDVVPTNSVIYASDDFDKAWEYGDFPKVVLALDSRKVKPSWQMIPADTPPVELAEIGKVYPTAVPYSNGESLWLSRLPADDPRIATDYEASYAFWIPGNPLEAVRAVFVFMPS
ncbi:hypothetical protein ACQPZQ_34270 [Pseudonocardia sp. CA-142604]|uniref:hypothetical protein n=1 Tax=Pseudonocardia sp. CA-142604 TaxID=3240024 RepID=UPI003D8B770E